MHRDRFACTSLYPVGNGRHDVAAVGYLSSKNACTSLPLDRELVSVYLTHTGTEKVLNEVERDLQSSEETQQKSHNIHYLHYGSSTCSAAMDSCSESSGLRTRNEHVTTCDVNDSTNQQLWCVTAAAKVYAAAERTDRKLPSLEDGRCVMVAFREEAIPLHEVGR